MIRGTCPRRHDTARGGVTLVEVLVVIAILGLLVGLLVPSLQMAREAARQATCGNNLRQVAMAVHHYERGVGSYPSSWKKPTSAKLATGGVDGWSAHVLLLPFLDEQVTRDRINLNATFDENFAPAVDLLGTSSPISAVRVPVYLCPSEVRDEVRIENGKPRHYPLNYAFNVGVWFVFDPATGRGGEGAFFPESRLKHRDIVDGLTKTTMAAEAKAWRPYFRNAAHAADPGIPASADSVCSLGGQFKPDSGHTEWIDGRSHQTGFTAAFAPNTEVPCDQSGTTYDIDWTNHQEGKSPTISTYAAITARSYHPGMVTVAMMDGAVRPVTNEIDVRVWRALATRDGKDAAASGAP